MILLDNSDKPELPRYAAVDFGYVCPNCTSVNWLTGKETVKQRTVVCVGCDHAVDIVPLENVEVTYSMQVKIDKPKKKRIPKHVIQAINILMASANYKKPEAIHCVRQVPKYWEITDVKLLVRKALEHIRPS